MYHIGDMRERQLYAFIYPRSGFSHLDEHSKGLATFISFIYCLYYISSHCSSSFNFKFLNNFVYLNLKISWRFSYHYKDISSFAWHFTLKPLLTKKFISIVSWENKKPPFITWISNHPFWFSPVVSDQSLTPKRLKQTPK